MAYVTFIVLSAIQKLRIRLRAIKDARVNYFSVEDLIVALIGPRPTPFTPTEVDKHRILQHQRSNIAKEQELTDDLHQKEENHKHKFNPPFMWFLVAILYFIEFCGGADVLRKAGVEGGVVFIYAAMLTTAMFAIATVCARQEPRTARYYAWYAGFFGLGFVAAVVRYRELVAREDATTGESMALAGLMFAITVLPAWLAEVFIRKALDGRETSRDLKLTKRELKREQKALAGAQTAVEKINKNVADHDHVAGLIRAEYRRHWEYERKRLAVGQPPDSPTEAA
jgi:hypothetical protein